MKVKIFLITIITVFLGGCKDFLTEKPIGVQTTESFLGNPMTAEQNFEYMLRATYEVLNFTDQQVSQMNGGIIIPSLFGDMMSDDAVKGGNGDGDQTEYLFWRKWQANLSVEVSMTNIWIKDWVGIGRANTVLKSLETYKANLSQVAYNRFKGEALYLRAYFYFDLALFWGSVPYFAVPVLPADFKGSPSVKPQDLYKKIDADLTAAVDLVLEKSAWQSTYKVWPGGRATKGAVRACLAKVVSMEIGFGFNERTYQDLYDITKAIMSSGEYSLIPNYAVLYESPDGENCVESIFEVQCGNLSQGYGTPGDNLEPRMLSPRLIAGSNNGKKIFSGWGFDCPTQNLYDEFEAGDPRRECSIIKSGDVLWDKGDNKEAINISPNNPNCPTGYFNRKKACPLELATSGSNANYSINQRIYRYGDILLLNAEAAYQTGKESEAIINVNTIRKRARTSSSGPKGSVLGAGNVYPPLITDPNVLPDISATGIALLNAIKHERRVELAMEAVRTLDLYRWGTYADALKAFVNADPSFVSNITGDAVVANYTSHLIDGKVPSFPIPVNEASQFGLQQNPGY